MEDPGNAKRRRGLGVVTANACTECRKKRAKCDGATPCARCKTQNVDCEYQLPVRQSKENMRAEIDQLRRQQQVSDKILAALVSNDESDSVLEQLRNGATVEHISGNLDAERRRSSMFQDVGMSDDSPAATTYRGSTDQQAIRNAVDPAQGQTQSIGSSPFSAGAFSDGLAGSTEGYNMQGQVSWPVWPGGPSSSRLSNAGQSDDVTRWSPDNPSHSSGYPLVGTWHEQTGTSNASPDSTTQWAREQGRGHILGPQFVQEDGQPQESANVNQAWTQVTSDGELVEHLMALYFCWEYPTFASLSKEHFLDDFRAGIPRYCSPLLVNTLLAVGCRFSTQAKARVDPESSDTAGDHFFAEALRILAEEKTRHKLTTIQALGLMSIREASCGRSSESVYYAGQSVMIAIEMGLHLESESGSTDSESVEHAVKSATFWGAFSLDQAWSISIGRLPHFSKETKLMSKPAIVAHVEKSSWVPYTDHGDTTKQLPAYRALTADPGAPLTANCTQPSNVRSVYRTFCELSEIVHKALYVFYTPGVPLTGKALLEVYTEYIKWYDGIPEVLRLGRNFTPAVLFAHMYYHFAILLLFRPFIKLDIINSGVVPRDVCNQAAEAIATLVSSYSELYTLQRTPSFVPYFVLTSSITHLVTLGSRGGGSNLVHQGFRDLKVMTSCHGFARRACDILTFLAAFWEVDITMNQDNEDGKLEAKIDPKTLGRPRSTSMNRFAPNMQSEDLGSGIKPATLEDSPLFWPFPMQGRPLLGTGEMIEKSGFRILTADAMDGVKMKEG